jgi:uncharacterized membrane protein YcgQ (UPF0703/DUF1980 family)
MKKIKHIEKDTERVANGMMYYIAMIATFLIMFFAACYILNGIIDPMLETLEALAENALRMAKAILKIGLVTLFIVAIYKVFLEPERK